MELKLLVGSQDLTGHEGCISIVTDGELRCECTCVLYSLVLRSDSCAICVIHVTCRPGHPWFSSTLVLMADALLWWR